MLEAQVETQVIRLNPDGSLAAAVDDQPRAKKTILHDERGEYGAEFD
ncbi:hypothetical protein OJ998_09965 [Solirubrobacter taibaiensis]|nr:hypothetical protein [Solirubrobacter taibaiensis]